jgi:hypothetical protein
MPGSLEKPQLYVEGENDKHAIKHLLKKYEIDLDLKPLPREFPEIGCKSTVQNLLKLMVVAISGSRFRSVGFVLDADEPLEKRWDDVRGRLREAEVENVPDTPPADGFIGRAPLYQAQVGVWLMPDNQQDGKIENFLRMLVDENDSLIGHAQSATGTARQLGATFKDADEIKAVIYSWLAWQEEPGHPFGRAIAKRYFRPDRPIAAKFVSWFRRLYKIASGPV